MKWVDDFIEFCRDLYPANNIVPLHAPIFTGNEKQYLGNCIDSSYVSYVGEYVVEFEKVIAEFTGARNAIAVVNGTVALHISLHVLGVSIDDEVLTQPLTFVATANAVKHTGATPVFIDVEDTTLGMSPDALRSYLKNNATVERGVCINVHTKKRIAACVPVHIFGHPCRVDKIVEICNNYCIPVVEDAAESLGSYYKMKHTGLFGKLGIISFNGNKIITTGGGGMVITDDDFLAQKIKHLTTTAKLPHKWNFAHDETAFNYRLSNVNAAIGCAQMEKIQAYLKNKRETASYYMNFFKHIEDVKFFNEPTDSVSNYWLNTIILKNSIERDYFLEKTNSSGVVTRPAWELMTNLRMYNNCHNLNIAVSEDFQKRIVNLPSSVRL